MGTMPEQKCGSCGAKVKGPYCGSCGRHAPAPVRRHGLPRWPGAVLIGSGLLVMVAAIVLPSPPADLQEGSPFSGEGVAPARRRFQQLVDMVSAAVEGGNSATVRHLSQEALTTFATIPPDQRDVDSRYHVAMLMAVAGDWAGALAEADSILAAFPDHLFGYYVRGVVAQLQHDSTGARQARTKFTAAYAREMASERPEYLEHRQLLEAFFRKP